MILRTAAERGSNPSKMYELEELLNDPKFASAPSDSQFAMLNALRGHTGLEL
jgi:hypothetical protein